MIDMSDKWVDSLQRRIHGMHHLLNLGVDDMTLEQVNHHERPGVLPAAFSLMHVVCSEDDVISTWILRSETIWENERWEDRVGVTVHSVEAGTPIEDAEKLRFSNLDAWRSYQRAVFERTEAALRELRSEELFERIDSSRLPREEYRDWYMGFVVPTDQQPMLLDVIECFVYQHGIRHAGELEHARALVGLGGLT